MSSGRTPGPEVGSSSTAENSERRRSLDNSQPFTDLARMIKEAVQQGIEPVNKRIEALEESLKGENLRRSRKTELEREKWEAQKKLEQITREIGNFEVFKGGNSFENYENAIAENHHGGSRGKAAAAQWNQWNQHWPNVQFPQMPQRAPGMAGGNRFRAESLPKFRGGGDLETWVSEMDHYVRLWGEQVVCPMIFSHCLPEGDVTRSWYMSLGEIWQQSITEDDGCWRRFQRAIRSKWGKSSGEKMVIADDRRKMPNETYVEYAFRKIELCKAAYPHFNEEALIEKVKERMGNEARRYCREKMSCDRLIDELVEFDRTNIPNTTTYQRQYSSSDTRQRHLTETNANSNKSERKNSEGKAPETTRNSGDRIATIKDRMNPNSGKMTRSFTDREGKTVFLQRACGLCTKNGINDKMHFRFECPNDNKINAFNIDIDEEIIDTPYTSAPTSHNFSAKAAKYMTPYVSEQFDTGFDTDDEMEGNE